jgi:hypothetical protein
MRHQFLEQWKALIRHILKQAVDRGEIAGAAISDELWDLLPGCLIARPCLPSSWVDRVSLRLKTDSVVPGES